MKKPAARKAPQTNRQAPINDLAPKTGTEVRGGREATAPVVREIVVTKDQDIATTNLWK